MKLIEWMRLRALYCAVCMLLPAHGLKWRVIASARRISATTIGHEHGLKATFAINGAWSLVYHEYRWDEELGDCYEPCEIQGTTFWSFIDDSQVITKLYSLARLVGTIKRKRRQVRAFGALLVLLCLTRSNARWFTCPVFALELLVHLYSTRSDARGREVTERHFAFANGWTVRYWPRSGLEAINNETLARVSYLACNPPRQRWIVTGRMRFWELPPNRKRFSHEHVASLIAAFRHL